MAMDVSMEYGQKTWLSAEKWTDVVGGEERIEQHEKSCAGRKTLRQNCGTCAAGELIGRLGLGRIEALGLHLRVRFFDAS
jgi:hypothetical protein